MNTEQSLIQELYSASCQYSIEDYKESVFNALKPLIPFDSGLWFTGSSLTQDIHPSSVFLHQQPLDMLHNFMLVKETDPLLLPLQESPGKALRIEDVSNTDEWRLSDNYLKHCGLFNIEQALSILIIEPLTSLYHVLSLYRSNPDSAFIKNECHFIELIFPHMIQGRRNNLSININAFRHPQDRQLVCNETNNLIATYQNKHFQLIQRSGKNRRPAHIEKSLVIKIEQTFKVQDAGLTLTPMELTVAQLTCDGQSNKDIAETLKISPFTVRNHLHNISRKLGNHNRSQLSAILAQDQLLEPRDP